jgi:hypothetical protein
MFEARVTYDDGETVDVTIGQRDHARWEAQPFGGIKAAEEKPVTYARYCAWAALQRQQNARGLKWDQWDAIVDEVEAVEDEDETSSDPTA